MVLFFKLMHFKLKIRLYVKSVLFSLNKLHSHSPKCLPLKIVTVMATTTGSAAGVSLVRAVLSNRADRDSVPRICPPAEVHVVSLSISFPSRCCVPQWHRPPWPLRPLGEAYIIVVAACTSGGAWGTRCGRRRSGCPNFLLSTCTPLSLVTLFPVNRYRTYSFQKSTTVINTSISVVD